MNEYDNYLQDYLLHHFRNMKADRIPRNLELEKNISDLSKAEFMLYQRSHVGHGTYIELDFSSGGVREGSNKFLIPSRDHIIIEHKGSRDSARYRKDLSLTVQKYFDLSGTFSKHKFLMLAKCSETNHGGIENIAKRVLKSLDMPPVINLKDLIVSPSSSLLDLNFSSATQHFYYTKENHNLYAKEKQANAAVYSEYKSDYKVLLPAFWGTKEINYPFCFFPFENKQELFNSVFLKKQLIVILTDSIELASINQTILDRANCSDIIWLSWYGEDETIKNVNWSVLEGRRVYYLLKEHSGFGTDKVLKIANKVNRTLQKQELKEFKYVSFLSSLKKQKEQSQKCLTIPFIYTAEELQTAQRSSSTTVIPSYKDYRNRVENLKPRTTLLKPFFHSETVTLIYSPQRNSGKTFFAMQLAVAISRGKPALEGWTTNGKAYNVLYLHGEERICTLEAKIPFILGKSDAGVTYDLIESLIKNNNNAIPLLRNFKAKTQFYTGVINLSGYQCDDSAMESFILNQSVSFMDNHRRSMSTEKLAVIDNILDISSPHFPNVIRELKNHGWTIVIIAPGATNKTKQKSYWKKLPIDNIIRVEKEVINEPGTIAMAISLENGIKLPAKDKRKFTCKLNHVASPPTFVKEKMFCTNRPSALLVANLKNTKDMIQKFHEEGWSEKAIATELRIEVMDVKNIKRRLGLSKQQARTNTQLEKVEKLMKEKRPFKEICNELNRKDQTVKNLIKKLKEQKPDLVQQWENDIKADTTFILPSATTKETDFFFDSE